ncbi:MAG: glycosyltransferase family 1 protein [Anaerolineales bacterium]|nr:glycosyltransferase family 1 protein [Anaerolineales bacterium]
MCITIFGAGSQGDIQPCLRLGKGLQDAGFQVLLAAPQNFADLIGEQGVPFRSLRGDVQKIMAGETGQKFMEKSVVNPIQSILAMRKMLGPIAVQMAEDALEACRDAAALITLAVFAPFGKTIAEICGIPLILVEPTPVLPTRNFPAPGWLIQKDLGRLHNRLSGFAMLEVIWQWYRPFVNEFRYRFGLHPLKSRDFHRILTSTPLLGAYSPRVIPHPQDWLDNVHITGYWFQDNVQEWRPSIELETFLKKGEAPVYVGFGSMAGRNPEHFARIVLEAMAKSGQRGLLATGWGGMSVMNVPKNVFVLDSAPHGWLFPRMAAVVHHGGAGTTAEGLRAGKPTVIVPFIVDQLFWGNRVKALGAGVEPISAKGLTVDQLAEAIQRAVNDAEMKRMAESIGKMIRSEDGVGNAVRIIQQYLGT